MLRLKNVDFNKDKVKTFVIPVCEDKDIHDNRLVSSIKKEISGIKEFKGRKGDEVTLYNISGKKIEKVIFIGIGKVETIDAESLRAFAGSVVKKCIQKGFGEVMISVPSAGKIKIELQLMLKSLMEGGYLGNHIFDKYKKDKKNKPLKRIDFFVKADIAKKFNRLSSHVKKICDSTIIAREWVNTPSNDKKPVDFTKSIAALGKKAGLNITVLDEKQLKMKKFGSLLAVAAGSINKPRMVIMEYSPKKPRKTVVLVGKGVTFDSGGINLKTSEGLNNMKMDMAGAAAVASTLIAVSNIKPDIKVVGVLPIVENMPSGSAIRPGDVIKSFEGKTIEIGNTDAEGRLILIDAMAYAIKKYKPNVLIDVATLTGACVVALGEKIAGVFSFDNKIADSIVKSGERTFERCWQMPMPKDYKEFLKSEIADIKNIGNSRYGGAITAAMFLSEFTGDTKWAHIDIAGPAFINKGTAYCGAGGSGFGVRLLCDYLENI
ncbi:MAG: leucyl aminopeptidase [Desulfobacterales bacterium]|nr:leucyl aminopeptidase [Desulfobacteraceae bacterium]MBT4365351.1 leucyl aminopeptidase [Desulfobacteraceae bacterium]MBT7084741.1 leucyl aminopeptidase [Desulfobacterales bacterium]